MANYLIDLKPIPIFKIENFYECSNEEIDYLKSFEYFENTTHNNYITKDDIFKHKGLQNLKNALITKFHYFTSEVIGIKNKFKIERNWVTLNSKGQHHNEHSHPNIVFASAFYVKCEKGALNFKTDNNRTSITEAFNFSYEKNINTIYNSNTWKMPVKTGDLIIFPGHIVHSGDVHLNDSERIMIGANWFPRGRLYTNIIEKAEWLDL